MRRRADRPDIELGASVKAKKLRFEQVPETDDRYVGESSSVTERTNLPEEVEPGVTYENVEVRWHTEVKATQGRKGS
jgi:hypothetical protein